MRARHGQRDGQDLATGHDGAGDYQIIDGIKRAVNGSSGVVAQSIGGGGGDGGINISGSISADLLFGKSYAFSFGLGGFGGAGGDAGIVDLTVNSLTTSRRLATISPVFGRNRLAVVAATAASTSPER